MSFADHIAAHRNPDGTYDLPSVEADYAEELRAQDGIIEDLILKAAKHGRRQWETNNRGDVRKQWDQPALSPELDMQKMIPIGDDQVIEYGAMDRGRITQRKDLRTKKHLDELDSFQAEMRHWYDTEAILPTGSLIRDSIRIPGGTA